jgi:hypothetical protein
MSFQIKIRMDCQQNWSLFFIYFIYKVRYSLQINSTLRYEFWVFYVRNLSAYRLYGAIRQKAIIWMLNTSWILQLVKCMIWGIQGVDYEDGCLLEHATVEVNRIFAGINCLCLHDQLVSRINKQSAVLATFLLALSILRPWRWRQYVPLKHR